jgi:peptidyl-prolyl cis-trans isomerase-like 3
MHLLLFCIGRNIKDFMVQTGDPTGTGKGGTSIWGRKFEDEFHETLKVGYIL